MHGNSWISGTIHCLKNTNIPPPPPPPPAHLTFREFGLATGAVEVFLMPVKAYCRDNGLQAHKIQVPAINS